MTQILVTANRLNKRTAIPAVLPDKKSIAGIVFKGFRFEGQLVKSEEIPNPDLGRWYKDEAGYFFWAGACLTIPSEPLPITTEVNSTLTAASILAATGATSLNTAKKFLPYLIQTCEKYKIDTPARQLCFLAQVGHESAGLFYTEELASGRAYEGRADLGNIHSGDGVRFKGRGLIQITGRANYQWLKNDMGIDFTSSPTLLGGKNAGLCSPEQLKYATRSAGWYWKNHDLNEIADRINLLEPIDDRPNLDHFKLITRKINGGYNGLSDRVARFRKGVTSFT